MSRHPTLDPQIVEVWPADIRALVAAWDLLLPPRMLSRFLLLGFLALAPLQACFDGGDSLSSGSVADPNNESSPGDGTDGMGGGAGGCELAADCVLAASTCCDCPSFAVAAEDGNDAGCEEVNCDATGLCPAVEATCDQGQCLMVCSPLIADKICSFGFDADEAGCLLNECAPAPSSAVPECEINADCVQVPADCCGCGLGGLDKAIPAALAEENENFLNCPVDPACPGINVCNADESAQCIAGSCALVGSTDDGGPPGAPESALCGTPELPPCATGFSCVLNDLSANDAASMGVGSCVAN